YSVGSAPSSPVLPTKSLSPELQLAPPSNSASSTHSSPSQLRPKSDIISPSVAAAALGKNSPPSEVDQKMMAKSSDKMDDDKHDSQSSSSTGAIPPVRRLPILRARTLKVYKFRKHI